jgi:shikimate dehydrogenase
MAGDGNDGDGTTRGPVRAGAGEATPFGLVGRTLGHSYSPRIHEVLGSVPYGLIELPDEDAVRAFLARREFRGVNVTMPYKRVALRCCDELSEVASRLGNVNTVVRRPDGTLYGDNTDYHGFRRMMGGLAGPDCARGRTCLVMGDGGASLTVRAALADMGASEVLVASRRGELTYGRIAEDPGLRGRVEVFVNTTPVGMYPHADDGLLLDPADFPRLACVADIVYNPLRTRLVQRARELGVVAGGGLAMLVAQARSSSDLFLGVERDDGAERDALGRVRASLLNVALIGMPGAGKSGVGRRLAELLGKEFVDVDDMVALEAGMPVPEIFERRGERGFRDLEVACTARACARPNRVIATGGGVVTRPENLASLRSNGVVVLLTRGLGDSEQDALSVEGRPMSQAKGISRLREEREATYRAWADLAQGPSPQGPLPVAAEIARQLAARGLAPQLAAAPGPGPAPGAPEAGDRAGDGSKGGAL